MLQLAAAVRASALLRRILPCFAREMFRQRPPCWFCCIRGGCGNRWRLRRSNLLRLRGFEFVQPQLQLLDLAVQLLRFAPELPPPQLGDQQLQVLDSVVARGQLRALGKEFFGLREKLLVLEEDQRLQRFGIQGLKIRKRRAQGHRARSMPETFLRARKKHTKKQNQRRKLRKKKIVLLTPPSAVRNCALAAASRCLPATSTTALASTKPCRSPLAAR